MLAMDEKLTPFLTAIKDYSLEFNNTEAPSWLRTFRQDALTRFLSSGIPTTKNEDWKYTNLSEVSNIAFEPIAQTPLPSNQILRGICSADEPTVVFVNGIIDEKLSSLNLLPQGLTLLPLKTAYREKETQIKTLLANYESTKENNFVTLNHALNSAGYYIDIADKAIIKKLIHIVYVTTCKAPSLTTPRTLIIVGKSAEATILETHLGIDESSYLSVPLTDIFLNENTTLHYCKAQSESLKAYQIGNTRVWQERDSHFDGFSLSNGAAITRNDLDIVSNAEGTQSTLNGFYGVCANQHVDNHSSMDHRFANCTSNQLYKGLLNGQSHSVFNGKIFVRPIAQKTNSYQLNKNLILGDNCRVDTKPQLEIFADDVKCTHGATIGQLNSEEIFYLQTRCISKKEAIKILAHGFVEDILSKIHHPDILKKLTILLQPTFAALE